MGQVAVAEAIWTAVASAAASSIVTQAFAPEPPEPPKPPEKPVIFKDDDVAVRTGADTKKKQGASAASLRKQLGSGINPDSIL